MEIEITELLSCESKTLKENIKRIERECQRKEPTVIIVRKRKNSLACYEKNQKGKEKYIPLNKINSISSNITTSYYSHLLGVLKKELHAIETFLKAYHPEEKYNVYERMSEGRKVLVAPVYKPIAEVIKDWEAKAQERRTGAAHAADPYGNTVYKTLRGEYVRSKSELYIANTLFMRGIPYIYEDILVLGDAEREFHPDFHVLNPRTGKDFYWEHFGMMDDPEYAQRACAKLNFYAKHGILPGKNLIVTYEGGQTNMDTEIIDLMIETYLS